MNYFKNKQKMSELSIKYLNINKKKWIIKIISLWIIIIMIIIITILIITKITTYSKIDNSIYMTIILILITIWMIIFHLIRLLHQVYSVK